ncbi:hypothetical protein [Parvimonas sp. G1604]|uniref:hypothetical protein n=1 Tax=Parvimonas sp. G1604 TaxID=3388845 RepID=UPI003981594F
MKFLFMDEKGPQNSFKISKPFNKREKLSYGTDIMHSYVANVIQINEEDYKSIENEYTKIVEEYLNSRTQLRDSLQNKGRELKGADLLKNNFDYGIASMSERELNFYINLLNLLLKYDVHNLLFMISKMSIITSSRLQNYFYYIGSNTRISPFIVKYIITKYAEIEASKEVIEAFLDKNISTYYLLKLIRQDMKSIVQNNKNNTRMFKQITSYREIIEMINHTLNDSAKLEEPELSLSFDWKKVKWAFDLWITERKFKNIKDDIILFLDEGIPKNIFEDLNFYKINDNCNSKSHIGLQITDMIVVICGKLISKLNEDVMYDFENPKKRVLVAKNYFELNEKQFNLVKKLYEFIINRKSKYHFMNDSYFDESVLLQTYLEYIASYEKYDNYIKFERINHPEIHMKGYIDLSESKFLEVMYYENLAKNMFGTIKEAIESGLLRPL